MYTLCTNFVKSADFTKFVHIVYTWVEWASSGRCPGLPLLWVRDDRYRRALNVGRSLGLVAVAPPFGVSQRLVNPLCREPVNYRSEVNDTVTIVCVLSIPYRWLQLSEIRDYPLARKLVE